MNIRRHVIAALILALSPLLATAQEKIVKAFDAIIDSPEANVSEDHTLQRDPETGSKLGQSDVYRFTLPPGQAGLIKAAKKAFREDNDRAYSINSGKSAETDARQSIAVGDGSTSVVVTSPGCDYIYSCFLAPKEEDPDGHYRYAYAMTYRKEEDGSIVGRLAVTYAITLKHRQERAEKKGHGSLKRLMNVQSWGTSGDNGDPWFRMFMKYVNALNYSNEKTRATNAGYIYEVVKDIDFDPLATSQDRDTAREILRTLLQSQDNQDQLVQQLLNGALKSLK